MLGSGATSSRGSVSPDSWGLAECGDTGALGVRE